MRHAPEQANEAALNPFIFGCHWDRGQTRTQKAGDCS
jgi:hypothetical protein